MLCFLLLLLIHSPFSSIVIVDPTCFPQAVASAASGRDEDVENGGEQDGEGKPLSLKWPETPCQQAVFLFLLPITFPLWLTLPDARDLVGTWLASGGPATVS